MAAEARNGRGVATTRPSELYDATTLQYDVYLNYYPKEIANALLGMLRVRNLRVYLDTPYTNEDWRRTREIIAMSAPVSVFFLTHGLFFDETAIRPLELILERSQEKLELAARMIPIFFDDDEPYNLSAEKQQLLDRVKDFSGIRTTRKVTARSIGDLEEVANKIQDLVLQLMLQPDTKSELHRAEAIRRLTACVNVVLLGFEAAGKTSLAHAIFPLQGLFNVSNNEETTSVKFVVLQDKIMRCYDSRSSYKPDKPEENLIWEVYLEAEKVLKSIVNSGGTKFTIKLERVADSSLQSKNPLPSFPLLFRFLQQGDFHEWCRRLDHVLTTPKEILGTSKMVRQGRPTDAMDLWTARIESNRTVQTFVNQDLHEESQMPSFEQPVVGDGKLLPPPAVPLINLVVNRSLECYSLIPGSSDASIEVTVWDFAGQDRYYCNHQHYVTAGAIFLVLYDCSQSLEATETNRDVVFWVCSLLSRNLIVFGKDGESDKNRPLNLFIIGTHFDVRTANNLGQKGRLLESIQESLDRANATILLNKHGSNMKMLTSTISFVQCSPQRGYDGIKELRSEVDNACQLALSGRTEVATQSVVGLQVCIEALQEHHNGIIYAVNDLKRMFEKTLPSYIGTIIEGSNVNQEFHKALKLLCVWGKIVIFSLAATFVIVSPAKFAKDPLGVLCTLLPEDGTEYHLGDGIFAESVVRDRIIDQRKKFMGEDVGQSKEVMDQADVVVANGIIDILKQLKLCFSTMIEVRDVSRHVLIFPASLPRPEKAMNDLRPSKMSQRLARQTITLAVWPEDILAAFISNFHIVAEEGNLAQTFVKCSLSNSDADLQLVVSRTNPRSGTNTRGGSIMVTCLAEQYPKKDVWPGLQDATAACLWIYLYLKRNFPGLDPEWTVDISAETDNSCTESFFELIALKKHRFGKPGKVTMDKARIYEILYGSQDLAPVISSEDWMRLIEFESILTDIMKLGFFLDFESVFPHDRWIEGGEANASETKLEWLMKQLNAAGVDPQMLAKLMSPNLTSVYSSGDKQTTGVWKEAAQRAAFTRELSRSVVGWVPVADVLNLTGSVNASMPPNATTYIQVLTFVNIVESSGCSEAALAVALRENDLGALITSENGFSVLPGTSLRASDIAPTLATDCVVLALGASRTVDALDIALEFGKAYDAIMLALIRRKVEATSPWGRQGAFCMHQSVSDQNMRQFLQAYRPLVVHLSSHASLKAVQLVENGAGERVTVDRFAAFLKALKTQVRPRLVVLNGCNTYRIAERLCDKNEADVPFTIGVDGDLPDEAARDWSTQFYQSLALGSTVKQAFDLANTFFVGKVYKSAGGEQVEFWYRLFPNGTLSWPTIP